MRLLALPGFADTPAYWSGRVAAATRLPIAAVEWPGLWGVPGIDGDPVAELVIRASALADERTVLVGHSLGARLALRVAAAVNVAGVVLLAPALGPLSFVEGEQLTRWKARGVRPTWRPDPRTGRSVQLDVPYVFGAGAAALPSVVMPPVPSFAVLMSEDVRQNMTASTLLGAMAVHVDGPHRWWEDEQASALVCAHTAAFVRSLDQR